MTAFKAAISVAALLLFAGGISARETDTTDIYYRALRNYLKYEKTKPLRSGTWETIHLWGDNVTTRNIPDTVDGCAVIKVWSVSEIKGRRFTIFYLDPAAWVEGGFEIRVRQEHRERKGRKKLIAERWSYFPLKVEWDTAERRYVLIPEEEDICEVLGSEIY